MDLEGEGGNVQSPESPGLAEIHCHVGLAHICPELSYSSDASR